MAGTLTLSTLSDGTNSTSATNAILGSAKAWANFDGNGGTTINGSFNVSSITRSSLAVYVISFTNVTPNANYAVPIGVALNNGGQFGVGIISSLATSGFTITTANFDGSLVDGTTITFSVFTS
jgi:hypothetical protein